MLPRRESMCLPRDGIFSVLALFLERLDGSLRHFRHRLIARILGFSGIRGVVPVSSHSPHPTESTALHFPPEQS
jgi:hypothetical protein